jgi:hypothetical protein
MNDIAIGNQPQIQNQNQIPGEAKKAPEPTGLLGSFEIQKNPPPQIGEPSLQQLQPSSQSPNQKPLQDKSIISGHPPFALYKQARHDALPDRARMIEKCGSPKDNIFFIKMSTAYKSVLTHLDTVQKALSRPCNNTDAIKNIDQALAELKILGQATDQYIQDTKTHHRFTEQMKDLKQQITLEQQSLQDLQDQLKTSPLPDGLSLKEAIAYAREGIRLTDMKFFKDYGVDPVQARKLIENDPEKSAVEDKIKFKLYPEKVCQDAQTLRNEIRNEMGKTGKLPFEKIPNLINQAEYAVKLYVDLFVKSGKIPDDLLKDKNGNVQRHAKLENLIDHFPVANLSDAEREVASKLMDMIHENTYLINLKYQDFDPRFTVPVDANKEFGHAEGRNSDKIKRDTNQTLAKNMLYNNLCKLVPPEKLKIASSEKDHHNIDVISNHFKGFLQDRLDARLAFGLLEKNEKTTVLNTWLKQLPASITDQEKKFLIKNKLPELINALLPNSSNVKIGKQLGKGAFGEVSEGIFNKEPVVVKIIQTSNKKTNYAEAIVESLHQAEQHGNPHVPKFIGVESSSTELQVFMEKIDGGAYDELFKNKLPIDRSSSQQMLNSISKRAKVSIHCISGIAKGLESLHQRELVHCDLKSKNTMFDSKTLEPRLIDFGLCARKGQEFDGGTPSKYFH